MDQFTLTKFKSLFEGLKDNLISQGILDGDFNIHEAERADEMDMTSIQLQQSMKIRLRNREALYLKKIESALDKIKAGTFGICTSCDEEIGLKRLEARPTSNLCILCKEEEEREEFNHADGRKHKSVGTLLKENA